MSSLPAGQALHHCPELGILGHACDVIIQAGGALFHLYGHLYTADLVLRRQTPLWEGEQSRRVDTVGRIWFYILCLASWKYSINLSLQPCPVLFFVLGQALQNDLASLSLTRRHPGVEFIPIILYLPPAVDGKLPPQVGLIIFPIL